MTTQSNFNQNEGYITLAERVARAITALVMLAYPMLAGESPINLVALLPLIAIYPMYTAIVGWDPVAFVVASAKEQGKYALIKLAARIFLFSMGAVLIGATLLVASSLDSLGNFSVLALVAILPIYVAIFGENPLLALRDSINVLQIVNLRKMQSTVVNESATGIDKSSSDVPVQDGSFTPQPEHKEAA